MSVCIQRVSDALSFALKENGEAVAREIEKEGQLGGDIGCLKFLESSRWDCGMAD